MKLPPDIEFHEDIRLLMLYGPKGLINEAEIIKIRRHNGEHIFRRY